MISLPDASRWRLIAGLSGAVLAAGGPPRPRRRAPPRRRPPGAPRRPPAPARPARGRQAGAQQEKKEGGRGRGPEAWGGVGAAGGVALPLVGLGGPAVGPPGFS